MFHSVKMFMLSLSALGIATLIVSPSAVSPVTAASALATIVPTTVSTMVIPAASPEANRQFVTAYYAAYNKNAASGNAAFFDQFLAADYVDHQMPPNIPGLQATKDGFTAGFKIFPDAQIDVNDLIAEGDKVVVRNTLHATQKGPMGDFPASNKSVVSSGIDIYRLAFGKITEHWGQNDDLAMMQQIGAIPGGLASPLPTLEPTLAASPAVSTAAAVDTNKAIVKRIFDAFNNKTLDVTDPFVSTDFIDHNAIPDISGFKQTLAAWYTSFPDLKFNVEDVLAEGDKVAVRATASGTDKGSFRGMTATGNPVNFAVINIYRLQNGKVTEAWHIEDLLGLIQQLTPSNSAATATP